MATLLSVENLVVSVHGHEILRDVSLDVVSGETWGIVGASGAGKSMLARSIVALLPRGVSVKGGRVLYRGQDWLALKESERCRIRGNKIGFLVQNTASGLDPVYSVGAQMTETLIANGCAQSKDEAMKISADWLGRMGFSDVDRILSDYPHALSGGMAQRVYLAMVLMLNPELVIADEFSTGLDSTTEKEMLGLLFQVTEKSSLLLITHDIRLLAGLTDKLAVMIAGLVVEAGPTEKILLNPLHGYSEALLRPEWRSDPGLLTGKFTPSGGMTGCPFCHRCKDVRELCFSRVPEPREIDGRMVRCHRY